MFLSNETDIFRVLLPNTTNFSQGNCTRQYFFISQMLTYSKYLLSRIIAKSTFRTVFDSNKKYNCCGPTAFKSQRVGYQSNQKLLCYYQHPKNHFNS